MPSCKISRWKNVNEKEKTFFVPNLQDFQFGQDGWKTFFMKISWIWTCVQIFRKFSYWENMLLFWIMLNKPLLIFRIWVTRFTQERAPRQIFTCSKSTIWIPKKSVKYCMFKVNNKGTRTTFYCIYC